MKAETFSCERNGLVISGLAYLPEEDHLPIAIVSHGFMSNYSTTKGYAEWLSGHGYAAFCFDFNGGGPMCKSDKDTTRMSVETEYEDLLAVINYAKGLERTDEARVTLMGCSQGGYVSAMTAARHPDEVEKLILFYPALCIPDDARSGSMLMAKFDPDNIPDLIHCGPMKLGRCYPEAVLNVHFEEMIAPYEGPVLIVHGTQDDIVNPEYAKKAAQIYRNARLHLIEGAGHGFSGMKDEEALSCVEAFLREV